MHEFKFFFKKRSIFRVIIVLNLRKLDLKWSFEVNHIQLAWNYTV